MKSFLGVTLKSFGKYLADSNKSKNTMVNYMSDLNQFDEFLKDKSKGYDIKFIDQITSDIIRDFLHKFSDMSTQTRNRKRASLRAFFGYLVKRDMLLKNPMNSIDGVKNDEYLPKYLDEYDINRAFSFLEATSKNATFDKAVFATFLYTGMRVSEVVNIKVCDIDSRGVLIVKGKGGKIRSIPIHSKLRAYLKPLISKKQEGDNIFTNIRSTKLSPKYMHRLIKRIGNGIGRPEISPHSLRHTTATLLMKNKVPLERIQDILGHKDINTTRIYTHLDLDQITDAIEHINW